MLVIVGWGYSLTPGAEIPGALLFTGLNVEIQHPPPLRQPLKIWGGKTGEGLSRFLRGECGILAQGTYCL